MRGTGIALNSNLVNNFCLKIIVTKNTQGLITQGLRLEKTLPQNQGVILYSQLGDIKENPALGVGAANMVNDADTLTWRRWIMMQMQLDLQVVNDVIIKKGQITIDGNYAN